jgi:uncharacterized membrane protein
MAKTVVGLFESVSQAERVVQDLVDKGFRHEDISVMAHREDEAVAPAETEGTSGAAIGAGTGAVVGGGLGLLAGLGMLAIPGIGPVLAAGPLVATLVGAGAGAVAGGLIGALVDVGIPEEEAEYYAEGVRRGGTLVVVRAEEARVDYAVDLMTSHGAVDIDKRAAEWRQVGWTGAAPKAPPSTTVDPTMVEPTLARERMTEPVRSARDPAAAQAHTSGKGEDMETLERAIDIAAPVQMVYQQWTRFEEFPRFMEGVEEVRRLDGKRLHWVASIGGSRKEWDAEITDEIPNQRIAWRSERGEFNTGSVTFQPLPHDGTRVMVRLAYAPQGLMERVGDALGLVSRRIEGDLERFKQFVEGHGRETGAWRGTERDIEEGG